MKKKNIPLVQLVLETFEFRYGGVTLTYKVRPQSHFIDSIRWAEWNQRYAGRPAEQSISEPMGAPYYFVEFYYYVPWENVFLWADRVKYILKNGEDHPRGEMFGGFFREGGEK